MKEGMEVKLFYCGFWCYWKWGAREHAKHSRASGRPERLGTSRRCLL